MNLKTFTAGNNDPDTRSDCLVSYTAKEQGGISFELKSKVQVLYGDAIKELCLNELDYFGIKHADIKIDDSGALDFIIAARIEAALKQAVDTDKEYLLPILPENKYQTLKERFRFSRLYLPGNTPKMMLNAGVHNPYGIILDLEDSVAPAKKFEAKLLVRNALRSIDFYGAERMVRINQLPQGLDDIKYVAAHNVNLILIPKCENTDHILQVEKEIEKERIKHGFTYSIFLMPIIESALGIENAFQIAVSSSNIVAIAIGLEDFTSDLGVKRTKEGRESYFARTRIVNACKAAGIQPIDSVFSDVGDEEGLRQNVLDGKELGFEGIGCIHPRQIAPIHECYAPDSEEIDKAMKIVNAFKEAQLRGLGVISLGTKMIDLPVVKRAEKTIKLATELGLLKNMDH
jgi:citrate lyase subunit beta/citryl-CoA lyase